MKPTTARIVLNIALHSGWSINQLDMDNAFLNGHVTDVLLMAQPPGIRDSDFPDHICHLQKAIYWLKQAPRTWYQELRSVLMGLCFCYLSSRYFIVYSSQMILYCLFPHLCR